MQHDKRRKMRSWMTDSFLILGSAILGLVGLLGCEADIDPFEVSDRYYSLFGFLDTGVDTQFVRVMPLRDSIALADAARIDARVMLEDLQRGTTIELKDSLFIFEQGRLAFNFWTDEPITPGTEYRLRVERSDGAQTQATITMPIQDPKLRLVVPTGFGDPRNFVQGIDIEGAEQVVDLQLRYMVRFPHQPVGSAQPITISYADNVRPLVDGWGVGLNAYDDLQGLFRTGCPIVLSTTVFVATASADFPNLESFDEESLARPDVLTNVENGVGYIGGIASIQEPWPDLTGFLGLRQSLCARFGN